MKIGIIGAMSVEVEALKAKLEDSHTETVSGIEFYCGRLFGKQTVVARCGIGKVFAAICAQTMILAFGVDRIINTGVGGTLTERLGILDVAIADGVVQHDMDTSPLGDPKGLISGINMVYFEADERAVGIAKAAAEALGVKTHVGPVASGDLFVSKSEEKERIYSEFKASVCEMEGAAIAQVAFVNSTPVCVIRACSDSADEGSSMDYMEFIPIAASNSTKITLAIVEKY